MTSHRYSISPESGEHAIASERRRLTRVHVELPAAIERENAAAIPARITDVGVGGVFVESDVVPSYGSQLTLVLYVSGQLVRIPSVVAWGDERGFGVRFEALQPAVSQALLRAVDEAS